MRRESYAAAAFIWLQRKVAHTRCLTIWNWKAAVMSAIYRAPIFFVTTLRAGWRAALAAMATETIFRMSTSGFYGAATQAMRRLEPAWLAILIILVLAPAVVQVLEYGVHLVSGTPHARTGVIVSTAMTAVASLFNWYAMRHGAMLTGRESRSFGSDLRQIPKLILGFVNALPLGLMRWVRARGGS